VPETDAAARSLAMSVGMSFRDLTLNGVYGPADKPLITFYVPLLSRAVSYRRAVGYFSGRELTLAAAGVSRFIANDGDMQLICGAQLSQADVEAVLNGEPLEEALARRLLADPLGEGADIVARHHLEVLSYMAREGRLEIKVGVPVSANGRPLTYQESGRYFHTKYGIMADAEGNAVAFIGSNNDTTAGWLGNHETFSAFPSWRPAWDDYGAPIVTRFTDHWTGNPDAGWRVIDLPEAVTERLIDYTQPGHVPAAVGPAERLERDEPEEPAEPDLEAARTELRSLAGAPRRDGGTGVGFVTAPIEPLPHQLRIAVRAVQTYPRGYLLADEVGLGKTIEAGLIVRELFLSGKAESALVLVPASVTRQWQEELAEKLALDVARYDGSTFYGLDGSEIAWDTTHNPWSAFPVVLASSHLARRRARRTELLDAGPWDVVVIDEAHHARRRGSKRTDTPNSLLSLLQQMKSAGCWRALYLASATPMQMHPHEAWDLIALLGLTGLWGRDASYFERYYSLLRTDGRERDWSLLQNMLADHFASPEVHPNEALVRQARQQLGFAGSVFIEKLHERGVPDSLRPDLSDEKIRLADEWLRRHTPMRDRVFRTTRQTLHDYQAAGILSREVTIPERHVQDEFIDMTADERRLYDRIEGYIRTHYDSYTGTAGKPLGFIMTVYRRRLTSSFYAIQRSLQRRLDVLEHDKAIADLMDDDDATTLEESALFDPDEFDTSADRLAGEITELRDFLHNLAWLAHDSKRDRLEQDIKASLNKYETLVIFTQYTDTMDYLRDQLAQVYSRIACYSGRGGELFDPVTNTWQPISKAELKNLFRAGERVKILLGTDAMSEGLNLQTCGRLINYDMPWNFMRVEQRIGRLDRIGGQPVVEVSNYFYTKTVEEQIYKGIAKDFDWFTQIVGDAQPVLAAVEQAMTAAAMTRPGSSRDKIIAEQVAAIKEQARALADDVLVKLSDIADTTVERPPDLHPAATLDDLRQVLISNHLSTGRLHAIDGRPGVWRLDLQGLAVAPVSFALLTGHAPINSCACLVTFDRHVYENAADGVRLLTYATPELTALLAHASSGEREG
jgi:SNF2-related domain/Helicase conserved C-terminal domain